MTMTIRFFIIAIFLFLIDLYFYQAISLILKESTAIKKSLAFFIYWGITLFTFFVLFTYVFLSINDLPKYIRIYLFATLLILLISKIIGSIFILTDDLIRLFRWIGSYMVTSTKENIVENVHSISRLKFLNQIALGFSLFTFSGLIYGIIKGAFNYKVHSIKLVLPNLPSAFNGLKIIQISDIHSGSFVSSTPLEEVVKIIDKQNPDIIFFTGDLVNDRASETDLLIEVLSKIKAPLGVYSTLGNHDYGDYVTWESETAKTKNLESLKNVHSKIGWKLLMNEHVTIKKNDAEIAIIGIENWGGNFNFPKYGDLKKAYAGAENYPVKLLLSHDPSHWNLEVIEKFKNIDITFSGHTHGAQFGIEIPGFRWSPSQYAYKQWAGLYNQQNQYLYVNRGVGFLGYPGRIGISPEITVMELFNS